MKTKIDLKQDFSELKDFLLLWSTQSLSQLGSSMTTFALTLWLYEQTGSSLSTAALSICSYAPYVIMSIFAGALTDRFNKKKTMLGCDLFAVLCTVSIFILYRTGTLAVWHLYLLNIISGLMNTVQSPASEVAMTLIIPEKDYQKTSGLRSLSRSLISILNPLLATALYTLVGLTGVICVDVVTFAIAFFTLLFFIRIPETKSEKKAGVIELAREGLQYLKENAMIRDLILFMAGINLVASGFDGSIAGYVIPNPRGGESMLGIVTSCSGVAMILGSLMVSVMPKPKNRVKVVYVTMLISMATENFLLAFSRSPFIWCLGQIIGWILIPLMSANLDIILRSTIPVELQGRVFACRNTLQFFTIPIGLFLGGFMVDNMCEPFMRVHEQQAFWSTLFGFGKGSGAALVMFIFGVVGTVHCLLWSRRLKRYHF